MYINLYHHLHDSIKENTNIHQLFSFASSACYLFSFMPYVIDGFSRVHLGRRALLHDSLFFSFLFLLVLIWFLHLLFMGSDQDQSLNVHSPYYLHPSESLLRILFHQFWTQWITIHGIDLCSLYWVRKNKVEFVNWSIQQPTLNHVLHSAWKKCNNIIVSCLVHSVSPSIRQSILWMDDALDIWKNLKSCYSQGNLLWVSELQQDMASIKQVDISITGYFIKLHMIWDELESYRPDLVCTFMHKCFCDVLTKVMERKNARSTYANFERIERTI